MTSHPHTAPRAVFLLAILAVFAACTQPTYDVPPGTTPKEGPADDGGTVAQTLDLKARGLYVTDNPMEPPPGSLIRADNAEVVRPGIVEVRRGNKPDAALSSAADALTTFTQSGVTTVIGQTGGNKLFRRTSTSASTDYSGTFEPAGDYRMRFLEENNNLYALTSVGVKRLATLAGTWGAAGAPPALEGTGTLSGASGFLDGQNVGATAAGKASVAYRFVWGNRDANGNLHLGAPSGRLVVSNTNTTGRDVAIVERIPADITAGTDFLQIYRTEIQPFDGSGVAIDPGEEMAQIAELFPSDVDIAAGTISYTDVATTANGPSAYFSPSQGGLINSREVPPISSDVTQFKGYDFYAVTSGRQRLRLSLLAVAGSAGLNVSDGIVITDGATENRYIAQTSETFASGYFKVYTAGTAAQNIEDTARSLVRCINATSNGLVYATYASAQNDPPGAIVLEARSLETSALTVEATGRYKVWAPALRATYGASALSRTANVVTATIDDNSALAVGDVLNLTVTPPDANFPPGLKTITAIPVPGGTTFQYAETGANATNSDDIVFTTPVDDVTTSDDVHPNTYARSDYNDAESVPVYNYGQVGSSSATLLRIIAQGDSLWFFTSEGLYRMTGVDETDFTIRPFDLTVVPIAPDSVIAAGNRIWAWTNQGVVSVSESGVQVVSQPIDKVLRELRATFQSNSPDLSGELAIRAFGVGYETEREYRLWLPSAITDAYATQCYVYNFGTGVWTRHTVSARAGVVAPGEDVQYLADTTAQLRRERKARTASDYQDADGVGIAFDVVYAANVASNPGGTKWWKKSSFLFESTAPVSVGVEFATEVHPGYETGTLTTNGLTYVSTYLPVSTSRSAVLYAGVMHSTAAEKCSVVGISVEYQPVSNVLR